MFGISYVQSSTYTGIICNNMTTPTAITNTTIFGCVIPEWQGDGYCDDENNNADCNYDGGDCCGNNVNTDYCTQCQCLDPVYSTTTNQNVIVQLKEIDFNSKAAITNIQGTSTIFCPEYVSIGNGICDESNNKLLCYYDGGDCSKEWINKNCTSFECIENSLFDPCPLYNQIGNGKCDTGNFNLICSYDGGDCEDRSVLNTYIKRYGFICLQYRHSQ